MLHRASGHPQVAARLRDALFVFQNQLDGPLPEFLAVPVPVAFSHDRQPFVVFLFYTTLVSPSNRVQLIIPDLAEYVAQSIIKTNF